MVGLRISSIALLIGLLTLAGCGDDASSASNDSTPSELEGAIVAVRSEGLGQVRAFTLRSGDRSYEIFIAEDVDYSFPLDHLSEHRISGEPVVVELEEREGDLYALSIEDA